MNPTNDGYGLLVKIMKLAFYVGLVVFVFPLTWMGYTFFIGPVEFTPFGFVLLTRMVLQLFFAWANNWEKSSVVRRAIILAVQEEFPHTKLKAKPWVRFDIWIAEIEQLPDFEAKLPAIVAHLRKWYELTRFNMAVVIPIYEISRDEALAMLEGIQNQVLKPSRVDAVVNNPTNRALSEFVEAWIAQLPDPKERRRWHFTEIEVANKRAAQAEGFKNHHRSRTFASVNVDSDVIAHRWANLVTALTYALIPNVEGITSNVRVLPMKTDTTNSRTINLWQWMIYWFTVFRYSYANNIERAAESFFGGVICLSGPWMSIRTASIQLFIRDWLTQSFRGQHFRPGDDRYATWWLNKLHKKTIYQPDIIVWTDVPFQMKRYEHQQLRWNQSGFVNFEASVRKGQILDLPIWSGIDTLYLGTFIYNLMFEFARITYLFFGLLGRHGLSVAWEAVNQYFWLFLFICLFRGIYAAVTSHNIRGLIMSLYPILFIRVQMPARLAAVFSLYRPTKQVSGQQWLGRIEQKSDSTNEVQ